MTDLPALYHQTIGAAIDADGISPHHCIVRKGESLTVAALALSPGGVLAYLRRTIEREGVDELVYGLDRFTKPGQGTSLGDVVAGGWYRRDRGWRIGIIEYQHEPRIVLPWCWDNAFWNAAVARELSQVFSGLQLIDHVSSVVGRA
ncbi:hypothetical protein ACJ41P_26480 [Azospirillum argentinense]|uniref:Uncharacterized protein n=1 Tax=Azospirillum argentinense TaxID=2970906 RepID=A0ABW8VE21_9PROT